MRAACLRALRYCVQDKADVILVTKQHIDFLIARCLDICVDNDIERIHTLRLIRHLFHINSEDFPMSLVHVLVAISTDGAAERDKMHRTCLATLCELVFFNPRAVCECGGMTALLKNVLDTPQLPRINESLLMPILYLLNHPRSRNFIKPDIDLEQLLAPFTDCHFRLEPEFVEHHYGEEKELRFAASKMAIVSLMRSWPSLIRLCKPDSTGLQSLLGVLYLDNKEARKDIMDILYDVFRLPVPIWTANFQEALASVDPSEMHDSWRLVEGFVSEEGKAILPHLAKSRPNLVENHMALLLSSFISAGIFEILVEVVTSGDVHNAVRGSILLGELLHMANSILPYECSHYTHCLPTLIALAASSTVPSDKRNRACDAIQWLERVHALKKRGPVPCSMFLKQIVQLASAARHAAGPSSSTANQNSDRLAAYLDRDDNEMLNSAIKGSQVLLTKDNTAWNWELISTILQWPDASLRSLEDQSVTRFIRRLVFYLKPSTKLYSSIELSHKQSSLMTDMGCRLMDFLVQSDSEDATKFIEELLVDINQCLGKVKERFVNQDELFSPQRLQTTCSQYYFLFLGRVSSFTAGEKLLQESGIFQSFLEMMTPSTNDIYVKLVVSSLDYSRDGYSRVILNKALAATQESAKQYTTSFMRVLLRARVPFLSNWGVEMLVLQLYDPSSHVAKEALAVITESCEDEVNLHTLVTMRPSVLHLGYKGALLLARFMSIPAGFRFLSDANYINNELKRWQESFNRKYVHIVEERLNEALTTYESTYDGSYVRRSNRRTERKDVFLPVHLYSQLVQHINGFKLLAKQEYLHEYLHTIRQQPLKTDDDIITLKAALWAVGHIGRSVWGIGWLQDENIIPEIIKLAEESGVFSVRGTAFYVLGLIASTRKGAFILNHFGWESTRHSRKDMWPVIEEQDLARPDENSEETRGMVSSLSCLSLARSEASSRHSAPRSRHHSSASYHQRQSSLDEYVVVNAPGADGSGIDSPVSDMSGPKASFFISKSRSNTIESTDFFLQEEEEDEGQGQGRSRSGTQGSGISSIDGGNMGDMEESGGGQSESNHQDETDQGSSSPYLSSLDKANANGGPGLTTKHRSISAPEKDKVDVSKSPPHARSQSEPVQPESGDSKQGSGSEAMYKKTLKDNMKRQRTNTNTTESDLGRSGDYQSAKSLTFGGEFLLGTPSLDKSRSSSTTDGTTSGIGSLESGHHGAMDSSTSYPKLSPIPSASSLNTVHTRPLSELSHCDNTEDDDEVNSHRPRSTAHPSDSLRRLANLKRIPSSKRRYSNPVLGPLSKSLGNKQELKLTEEYTLSYTSMQDAHGYAALRDIKSQRNMAMSLDMNTVEQNMSVITEEPISVIRPRSMADFSSRKSIRLKRSISLQLRDIHLPRVLSCAGGAARNMSSSSLADMDSPTALTGIGAATGESFAQSLSAAGAGAGTGGGTSGMTRIASSALLGIKRPPPKTSLGKAEYIGLCLPVDVNMIFQENEGEDKRSHVEVPLDETTEDRFIAHFKRHAAMRSVSQSDEVEDGLDFHRPDMCLGCSQVLTAQEEEEDVSGLPNAVADDEIFLPCSSDPASRYASMSPRSSKQISPPALDVAPSTRARQSSDTVQPGGSIVSSLSQESGAVMSEDTPAGRVLIRKEILKLVTNLSSSIGTKNSEKGLLILKQKFVKAFDDICLYSEICYLLAHYRFRLTARRFIQELFQDATFSELYEESRKLLKIPDASNNLSMEMEPFRLEQVPESQA